MPNSVSSFLLILLFVLIFTSVHGQIELSASGLSVSQVLPESVETQPKPSITNEDNGQVNGSVEKLSNQPSMIEKESEPTFSMSPPVSTDSYQSSGFSTPLKLASDRFTLAALRLMASQSSENDNVLMSPFGILMTYAALLRGASESIENNFRTLLGLSQFPDSSSVQLEFSKVIINI